MTLLIQQNIGDDDLAIGCGSVIKLSSPQRGSDASYHLYSDDMQMHGGSGQQIVTFAKDDPSSIKTLWQVRPKHHNEEGREYPTQDNDDTCTKVAEPVKCGSIIRLTHMGTKTNLHSHGVKSPLSKQQEVTSYGQGDGKGDNGDNWLVECTGTYWLRKHPVRLQHIDTKGYLGASRQAVFNQNNCGGGCPIMNHLEAFGRKTKDELSVLEADLGVYLHV